MIKLLPDIASQQDSELLESSLNRHNQKLNSPTDHQMDLYRVQTVGV